LQLLSWARFPLLARSPIPRDLDAVLSVGEEEPPRSARVTRASLERVWHSVQALYRTGVYPAVQIALRCRGHLLLDRALGHAAGNAPDDPPDAPKVLATTDTPFCLFSASKAITAMVMHKLDEQHLIHLDDRVCDYVPEFARHRKQWITLRHVLAHRSGIPAIPPEAMDLELLGQPEKIIDILCDAKPQSRPGQVLAYHAVSGGFVLGEVVRRATGKDIRQVLREEIVQPLGLHWMGYGVRPGDVEKVARNACSGPPLPPPISMLLKRALGVGFRDAVAISNDPRFLTGIVPAANVVATAGELAAFYQCLLDDGELGGVGIFEPRTVRHATAEHAYREIDLTLGIPLRYGLGLMLGDRLVGLFGPDTPNAFGHLGFTNIFGWADPDREISVALLTSGKPFLSLHAIRLVQFMIEINRAFPKRRRPRRRR
jgi:CubicO group peptidase (beta-lactamase class C family)